MRYLVIPTIFKLSVISANRLTLFGLLANMSEFVGNHFDTWFI